MNKFFKKDPVLRKSFYALLVVILSILFFRFTENIKLSSAIPVVLNVLSPFIIGAILAYILNCGVRPLEALFDKISFMKGKKRLKRGLAIGISLTLLIGIIVAMIAYIVPEIISSIQNIINFLMEINFEDVQEKANELLIKYNISINVSTYRSLMNALQSTIENITDFLKFVPNMLVKLVVHIMSLASSAIKIIIGVMVSVYILADKERIVTSCKKMVYLLFNRKNSEKTIEITKIINTSFNKFFVGKAIDSFIIGLLFLIGANIIKLPYPVLFAIIVGVTNMIPYFGPFIGAVPVVLLTLLTSPVMAIWAAIFIFILQQFDGLILGPKILGDSIGLKPLGVIFAITVGGAVAGPLGMFFGVPVFSVFFSIFMELVEKNYINKTENGESSPVKQELKIEKQTEEVTKEEEKPTPQKENKKRKGKERRK